METGYRSGKPHGRRAGPLDWPEKPAGLVLGVGGHLGHGLDLAEGDVAILGGHEKGARIRRQGERGDGPHHQPGAGQQHLGGELEQRMGGRRAPLRSSTGVFRGDSVRGVTISHPDAAGTTS